MLAHGTGVRQWQAVIVSLCLGGLCMPDTVVDGSMTPFVDESSVTKLMAHGKSLANHAGSHGSSAPIHAFGGLRRRECATLPVTISKRAQAFYGELLAL